MARRLICIGVLLASLLLVASGNSEPKTSTAFHASTEKTSDGGVAVKSVITSTTHVKPSDVGQPNSAKKPEVSSDAVIREIIENSKKVASSSDRPESRTTKTPEVSSDAVIRETVENTKLFEGGKDVPSRRFAVSDRPKAETVQNVTESVKPAHSIDRAGTSRVATPVTLYRSNNSLDRTKERRESHVLATSENLLKTHSRNVGKSVRSVATTVNDSRPSDTSRHNSSSASLTFDPDQPKVVTERLFDNEKRSRDAGAKKQGNVHPTNKNTTSITDAEGVLLFKNSIGCVIPTADELLERMIELEEILVKDQVRDDLLRNDTKNIFDDFSARSSAQMTHDQTILDHDQAFSSEKSLRRGNEFDERRTLHQNQIKKFETRRLQRYADAADDADQVEKVENAFIAEERIRDGLLAWIDMVEQFLKQPTPTIQPPVTLYRQKVASNSSSDTVAQKKGAIVIRRNVTSSVESKAKPQIGVNVTQESFQIVANATRNITEGPKPQTLTTPPPLILYKNRPSLPWSYNATSKKHSPKLLLRPKSVNASTTANATTKGVPLHVPTQSRNQTANVTTAHQAVGNNITSANSTSVTHTNSTRIVCVHPDSKHIVPCPANVTAKPGLRGGKPSFPLPHPKPAPIQDHKMKKLENETGVTVTLSDDERQYETGVTKSPTVHWSQEGAPGTKCPKEGSWPFTQAGAVVSLPCPVGTVGTRTRECGAHGNWSATDESDCVIVRCDGDELWPNTAAGQMATADCPTGYFGTQTRACNNGTWADPSTDLCNSVVCTSDGVWPTTKANTTAALKCPPRYSGQRIRYCSKNGTWVAEDARWCLPVRCPTTDGYNTTLAGSIATASCVGSVGSFRYRACQDNGTWGVEVKDSCPKLTCQADELWPEGTPGIMATISCPPGFSGVRTRKCDASLTGLPGVWGAMDDSKCKKAACSDDGEWASTDAGTSALRSCGLGFVGFIKRHCNMSAAWERPVSRCSIATCDEDGSWPNTTAGGRRVSACPVGQHGHRERSCNAEGRWEPERRNCTIMKCPKSEGFDETSHGHVAVAPCSEDGYVGSMLRSCNLGVWLAIDKSGCSPAIKSDKNCPEDDGWPETQKGTTAVTLCPDGFTGSKRRMCSEAGSWMDEIANCTFISCPAEDLWPKTPKGVMMAIPCPNKLSGDRFRQCEGEGVWGVPDESSCKPAPCSAQGAWAETQPGQMVTVSCGGGLVGTRSRMCTSSGQFGEIDSSQCQRPKCGHDGPWPTTETLQVATIPCRDGYEGTRTRLCNSTGLWASPVEDCTQVFCPSESVWVKTAVGTDARIPCDRGYEGLRTRSCSAGGVWQVADEKACKKISCPTDGSWESVQAGVTVTRECEAFESGSVTRRCGSDGAWQPTVSTCQRRTCQVDGDWAATSAGHWASGPCEQGFTGATKRRCLNSGTWGDVESECKEITCPLDALWGQPPAGRSVKRPCAPGYKGSGSRKCNAEGRWEPESFHCEKVWVEITEDSNFRGRSQQLGVGKYDWSHLAPECKKVCVPVCVPSVSDWSLTWDCNDKCAELWCPGPDITSVKVPEGLQVKLHSEADFKGKTKILQTGDFPNLGSINWNDRIKSMEIEGTETES